MRRDEALATLLIAHGWLSRSAPGDPGAEAAINGIGLLGGRLVDRSLLTPIDREMLVRMIVSYGRRHASGNANHRQLRALEDAARRAVEAAT